MTAITCQTSGQSCGATVHGVDFTAALSTDTVNQLRELWLRHQVLAFPDQFMSIDNLKALALAFGPRGDDPFIAAIPGHAHVVEIKREADEQSTLFAEGWHSDWSFLRVPPAGTMLYGVEIPPVGGDTLFANQYAAYEALPDSLKHAIEGRQAIHSARNVYSREGYYGERDKGRSMAIITNDTAKKTQSHPMVRVHPETGRKALFVNRGYTVGIEGMNATESDALLHELFELQTMPELVYRHRWQAGMVIIWDNRCLVHAATGGYEGYRRLLNRITIAERKETASAGSADQ